MAKKGSFSDRFPHFGKILFLALVISLGITTWSFQNAPTNIEQEAATLTESCVPIPTNTPPKNKSLPYVVTGSPTSCETVSNTATQYAACFTKLTTNGMSCSKVELYIDNKLVGTAYGQSESGNNYNIAWNTKNFVNGWHDIFVRGYDFKSRTSDSSLIKLYVNNAIPTPTSTTIVCTADVKLCSDGTYVQRIPPTCAFAPCPYTTPTPTPISQSCASLGGSCIPSSAGTIITCPTGTQYIKAECAIGTFCCK